MIYRITKYGEAVLHRKTEDFDWKNPRVDLEKLISDMFETMYAVQGVGLAAPQIGIPLRIAVVDVKLGDKSRPVVLINPRIFHQTGELREEEGCLSVPGIYTKVRRFSKTTLRAFNEKGVLSEISGEGFLARAFQHETDHLDGKIFVDRLPFFARLKIKRVIRQHQKQWT